MYPNNVTSKLPVSGTGILGCPDFQHNDKFVPIVPGQDKSGTSYDNNRG